MARKQKLELVMWRQCKRGRLRRSLTQARNACFWRHSFQYRDRSIMLEVGSTKKYLPFTFFNRDLASNVGGTYDVEY